MYPDYFFNVGIMIRMAVYRTLMMKNGNIDFVLIIKNDGFFSCFSFNGITQYGYGDTSTGGSSKLQIWIKRLSS